jgi:hypothetical protein
MVSRCAATTVAGSPCAAQPVRADGYCFWHSPALEAERDDARRRGGVARSHASRVRRSLPDGILTLEEVRGLLGTALQEVLAGTLEPGRANAAAAVARAYVAVTIQGRATISVQEAEAFMDALVTAVLRSNPSAETRTRILQEFDRLLPLPPG